MSESKRKRRKGRRPWTPTQRRGDSADVETNGAPHEALKIGASVNKVPETSKKEKAEVQEIRTNNAANYMYLSEADKTKEMPKRASTHFGEIEEFLIRLATLLFLLIAIIKLICYELSLH